MNKTFCIYPQFEIPSRIELIEWPDLADVRVWDTISCTCLMTMTSHTMNVTCLKWGGSGLIYSASQDRTIKVWRSKDGALCRTLQGHGHWVNVLALNTGTTIHAIFRSLLLSVISGRKTLLGVAFASLSRTLFWRPPHPSLQSKIQGCGAHDSIHSATWPRIISKVIQI